MISIKKIATLILITLNANCQSKVESIIATKNKYTIERSSGSNTYSNMNNKIDHKNFLNDKYPHGDIGMMVSSYFNIKEYNESITQKLKSSLSKATLKKINGLKILAWSLYLNKNGTVKEVRYILLNNVVSFSPAEIEQIEVILLKQNLNINNGEKFYAIEKIKYFPFNFQIKTSIF